MIVVTGGSGFLGSWIVRALYKESMPLVVLVRPDSDCWRLDGLENIKIVRSEPPDWPKVISEIKPRVVIASDWEGVAGLDRGNREMQFGNVSRSLAVAQAARDMGVEAFIAFGSQAEIGPRPSPINEDADDGPNSPYGESKVHLRRSLSAIFSESKTRFVWGRIFSVYGPLDNGAGMLPSLIRTLRKERSFDATSGDQVWSYLYAADFAAAVLRIIKEPDFSDIVNIGNPSGVPIKEVINRVAQYMNRPELVNIGAVDIDSLQSQYLIPVTSQLTTHLWEPAVTLDEGLRSTVDWFMGTPITWNNQELPLLKAD